MGRIVIAIYQPRKGFESQLMRLVKEHLPILRAEKLATDRDPIVMGSKEGAVLEIFEWRSAEAINEAHQNEAVRKLWIRFDEVCEFIKPVDVKEFQQMFPDFEAVSIA